VATAGILAGPVLGSRSTGWRDVDDGALVRVRVRVRDGVGELVFL